MFSNFSKSLNLGRAVSFLFIYFFASFFFSFHCCYCYVHTINCVFISFFFLWSFQVIAQKQQQYKSHSRLKSQLWKAPLIVWWLLTMCHVFFSQFFLLLLFFFSIKITTNGECKFFNGENKDKINHQIIQINRKRLGLIYTKEYTL